MSEDNNDFSFDLPAGNGRELDPEAEKLRQQIAEIHKKLTGENPEPVTNMEILQFLRVINYNFISLTRLLQAILLKNAEMDSTMLNLELGFTRINKHLQQFFETNSMIDEVMKGDFDVSGSASDSKFIF